MLVNSGKVAFNISYALIPFKASGKSETWFSENFAQNWGVMLFNIDIVCLKIDSSA